MFDLLARTALFKSVPPEGLHQLALKGSKRTFDAGSELIRQGEIGDSMHVILKGLVLVAHSEPDSGAEVGLTELGPGEVVGEMGVLDREPRSATVVAIEVTETLEIGRNVLVEMLAKYPEATRDLLRVITRRLRQTDEMLQKMRRRVTELEEAERARLAQRQEILDDFDRVKAFPQLPPAALAALADHGERRAFPTGRQIVQQGEASESLFVVISGRVRVTSDHSSFLAPLVLSELGPGGVVAASGVLAPGLRSATVTAVEDTEMIEIDSVAFASVLSRFPGSLGLLLRLVGRRLWSNGELIHRTNSHRWGYA